MHRIFVPNPINSSVERAEHQSRAISVLIESEPGYILFVLTHFLHANRCPLRSKTLQISYYDQKLQKNTDDRWSGKPAVKATRLPHFGCGPVVNVRPF
jgi:hypothetical protein